MAIFISSGLTLSPAVSPNYGIIGYKNYATTTNLSATSETAQNPATNMANPATAYRWEAGDSAYSSDAIVYSGTNLMPSPFDPSGWYGETTDPDGTITNVTTANPSGETFIGLAEKTSTSGFNLTGFPTISTSIGETVYGSMIIKNANALGSAFRFRIADSSGFLGDLIVDSSSGLVIAGGLENKITLLGGGYILIEFKYTAIRDGGSGIYCQAFIWKSDLAGEADQGSQLYVQAAYFGKNTEFPATVQTAGKIPKQVLTINTSGQDIDYIGIARHNLDQQGLTMTVKYDGVEVIPASGVSSKQAIIFLTQLAAPNTVTIEIDGAITAPSIAVLYVGLSIRLQRNIYVGHTPITYGRDRVAINGVSENGQYLGEIVVRETNSTSVNLQNLTPDWYRSTLDPFFALSPRVPCFWAWRPDGYPDEVSYCWIEGNPRPTNQRSNGMMEVSWNFKGVA